MTKMQELRLLRVMKLMPIWCKYIAVSMNGDVSCYIYKPKMVLYMNVTWWEPGEVIGNIDYVDEVILIEV